MDNIKIVDKIVKYYMNPKKYPNNDKKYIEDKIQILDDILLNGRTDIEKDLVNTLLKKYTSDNIDSPINSAILKTRADEQGLSSTREYREIYFNEIVQNANDNTNSDKLDVILAKDEENYQVTFEYNDKGFCVENIIGFFNTEIHTKRENLSATGKHGVGIKSLFYFVNHMKIESNVKIEFKIKTIIEEEIEKIAEVESKIQINEEWYDNENKKTRFTITFPKDGDVGAYNVDKLKTFINKFYQGNEVKYDDICRYFFGLNQNELIFDARGLLFTNKNKSKEVGIKNLYFYKENLKQKLFEISCKESKEFQEEEERVCKSEIKYNDITKLSYIVFTKESSKINEQNFTVAFPMKLENSKRRYYETYYIPEADEEGINILVNSKYSNVTRTRLADNDSEKQKIKKEIDEALIEVYKFMVSEGCAKSEIGIEVSMLFHDLLLLDASFIEKCYDNKLNNGYLTKYKNEIGNVDGKYIVYQRCEKEEFEKKLIGQKFEKEDVEIFFEKYILKSDSIEYDKNLFMPQIVKIYEQAFENSEQHKLRSILNVAGTIRDLIYYRVKESFPSNANVMLDDDDVDTWNEKIWNENEDKKKIEISLSIIGRYKLHSYITSTGEIKGASFYQYLFNEEQNDINDIDYKYPTLKSKQQELFNEQYSELKNQLLELLVNKEQEGTVNLYESGCNYKKGTVVFYTSWHNNAKYDTYFDMYHTCIKDGNLNISGADLTELLVKKILEEKEILKHVIKLDNRLMIASKEYPTWGEPTFEYKRNKLLKTGVWVKCKLINIDFIRRIHTSSWECFKFYVKEFLESQSFDGIVDKYGHFNLYTYDDKQNALEINVNDIPKIFKFFYENDRYKKINIEKTKKSTFYYTLNLYTINFVVNIDGDIQNNLCPADYYSFLQKQIRKNVYVMQTNSVNARKTEIMYWFNGEFIMWGDGQWHNIGKGSRTNKDEIIIIHNEKMDYTEAIIKVLESIMGRSDVLDKCKAFVPENRNYAIQGEEYENLKSCYHDINQRSQEDIVIQKVNKLSCEALKKIMIARGNNDNKCCCCGMNLTKANLIITNNSNNNTCKEYPQIMEVVCEKCEDILRKSHKNTTLLKENDEYYVDYCCNIQNSHQKKEIHFKFKPCSGILALCRRN